MAGSRALFTAEQEAFYRQHCRDLTYKQQVDLMYQTFGIRITADQCKTWRTNHKFFGSQTGRFQKGMEPINKGKRWDEFMSPEAQKRSRTTCFKKGIIPKNSRPIGSILQRDDGYLWIKVQDGSGRQNWKQLHRYVWEKANGEIPAKYKIVFLDGNTTNCSLDNLMMVSYRALAIANHKYGLIDDPEINFTILKTAELESTLTDKQGREG